MSYARSARGSSGGLADCWDLRISRLFFLFLKVSVPGFELRVDYEVMARLCCFGAGCSDVSPTFDRFPRLFLGHISRIFVNYFCVSITNTTRY